MQITSNIKKPIYLRRNKLLLFIILHISSFCVYSQASFDGNIEFDLSKLEQLQFENNDKVNAAFAAMDAVQKAGAYIESLSDLFNNQELTLPVGIKKGDYELIVQEIIRDKQTNKPLIHASCAFKFKDTGQPIAFDGYIEVKGRNGLGTAGKLTLMTPVQRKMGNHSTLIIREGTTVKIDCDGIESFEAKMAWMITSDKIIPTDNNGVPTNQPFAVSFDAFFQDFDNYMVSLNIDQSFTIKGLNDVIFSLKGATLDQSDVETSSMVRFPQQYFSQQSEDQIKLWKGVAISEATVILPQAFKKTNSNERISLSLQQVLFDENGFSGNILANNVIQSETIDPSSWDISLTDISLNILKNNIVSFGLGGEINIPPFGKNSLLPYIATYNPVIEEIEIKAGIAGVYEFPVLSSTITLNELSTIDILFSKNGIYPKIHASGVLDINAPLGNDSTKTFSVPGITFENMIISRESPYLEIGVIGVTGNIKSPSIAGFELSISDINSFENDKGSGLGFIAGVSLNEMFKGDAGLQLYGDYSKWKFKEVEVDKVHINYKSSAFSIAGGVWFKNSDPIFGNGFRGDVTLSLIDKFNFDAIGVFGKKDNYNYFLTDVFYETSPASGIYVPPILSFYGFGGGLYSRMQQNTKLPSQNANASDLEFGKSLSGISYLPDRNVGLGVMATTRFGMFPTDKAFNAKVGFEMQFNTSGGLNFVQFRGDAAFMDAGEKWGKLSDNVMDGLKKMEEKGITQPQKTNKSDLSVPENKSSGFLTASINIEYDLINKVFSADLNSYLNAGVLRGAGSNDRFGWASAYFSPQKWHVHLGTPSDKLGLKFLNMAEATSYFMLGHNIPALPLPPEKVLKNLSQSKQDKLKRSNLNSFSEGKGVAFGSAFELNFDARLTPFYAHMGVGVGAEFSLTNLNGKTCANYPGTPGINGWYADGQAWAYVEAGIGLEAKIFGKRRKFEILDISVGALLQGAGPNPLYLAGSVGGEFKVLGGLISGNCSFDFEVGEKCIIENGSPFGEEIISQLTPNQNAKEVNVFTAPQVIFNVPVEVEMTINEDDIKGIYKVTLEEFTVKYKDGRTIAGQQKASEDGTVYMFTPYEPFESKKDLEVYAKVGFQKRINNKWEYVNGDNNKPVFEDRTTAFTSGDRPKEIMPEHVKFSYPINKQYNFYSDEYKRGYILVSQNYSYLFSEEKPEGFDQIVRITDNSGNKYDKRFTYKANSPTNDVLFEIDFALDQIPFTKENIYKLAIVNVPKETNASIKSNITTESSAIEGAGDISITRQQATESIAQLSEKEIYALHFRTSKHNTFSEKIKTFDKPTEGWRQYVELFVHNINTNLEGTELFDIHEVQGINNQKIVQIKAQVDQTNWYNQTFYKGMYQSQTTLTPPVEKVEILLEGVAKQLTDDEINIGTAFSYRTRGMFQYSIPYWCARDFFSIRNNVAKAALNKPITQQEVNWLNADYPPVVFKGDYPVNVSYVLPGREITTSTVSMKMHNPVEP